MDSLDRNSRSRFRDLNETLKRAKRCLPEPEYQEVYHSYHAVIKNTPHMSLYFILVTVCRIRTDRRLCGMYHCEDGL